MTAYRKNIAAWIIIGAISIPAILATLYISNWFGLILVLLIGGGRFILNEITCPNCGTPVTYQGSLLGFRVEGGFINRNCKACGWDLDKEVGVQDKFNG
jgi:rubredoxin